MDNNTEVLINKLAETLGTTTEQMWGVLISQAPISGFTDLVVCVVLVGLSVALVRFVKKQTKVPEPTAENRHPRAKWDEGESAIMQVVTVIFLFFTIMIVISSIESISSSFFNPEYWALKQVLSAL